MDSNETSHYGNGTGSSANAINVTGSPVAPSHAVGRPPSSRHSSDVNSPSSSSRDHIPLNHGRIESLSSTSHAQAPVAGVNPTVASDTSQTAPRFQIDSPSSVTAYDESADVLSMSPLPKTTLGQVQNRLGSFLTTLNTLSVSFPHLSKTAAVVPLSAASHALHHAQHTAHVAVKGSNASFDIAQTMHTLAHHSHEAAARALDLAQQSLAAAQAAFTAAEQSSASAQAALVGCREARERAKEAVDAVQRVTAVLDAHEQSIAGWEEQVQKMAIETRSAVEELRSWATDLEQDGVRGRARRKISWETDEGKRADKQQHETSERRSSLATDASRWQVAEVVHDMETQPVGSGRRTLSIPIFGAPQVAGQIAVIESARGQQESRQSVLGHPTSIEPQGFTSSTTTPAIRTETRAQEASRKYQQKRYQATTMEQERARVATEPRFRAERTGQIARNGDAVAGEVLRGILPDAVSVTEGGPVSLPTSHVALKAPAHQRQSHSQAASLGPATTDTSSVLRSRFIPATTEAGRFLQDDLPFSSVTRTSGNNIDCGNHAGNPIFVSDSSPLLELPSDDVLDTRPVNSRLLDTSKHPNAPTIVNEGTPVNSLPTWTTLKREPSRDTFESDTGNAANDTLAEHPIALRSTPLLTPHVERLTTLRRVADASGIHPSPILNQKIKQEPSSSDALLRKTSGVGRFHAPVPRFDRAQDVNSAFPQHLPPRSVSPGDSTGNHPIQVGVTPPRMKKINRPKLTAQEALANDRHAADKGDSEVTSAERPSVGDKTRQIHSNGVDASYPQTTRSDRDSKADANTGDRHLPEQRSALNGRFKDDNGGDTRVPRERRLSDNRGEYLGKDGGFRGQKFDGYATRDAFVRGNDRSWGAPKSFISGRSPSPRQWDNSPPRRPSIRRDTYQGNTAVSPDSRSSPSLTRFSRPIIRRRYSPPSSPVSYGRSQPPPRPLAPPTSPQIGPRKRLRESTGVMPSSEATSVWRTWNDDSDTRKSGPGPWQASSDFSSPVVSRRTPSVSRTLASRMQEPPPHPLPPSDTGPNDNRHINSNPTRGEAAGTDVEDTATGPRAEHRPHSRHNSFSDRVRDYERDDLGPSSVLGKRKKFREMEGSEFQAELDGDRPYLLSRMSDQTRSPFRGFGSSIRGYSGSGRGYERGRGFGRGRGAPFSRGGYRGRMKPLQDRIH